MKTSNETNSLADLMAMAINDTEVLTDEAQEAQEQDDVCTEGPYHPEPNRWYAE